MIPYRIPLALACLAAVWLVACAPEEDAPTQPSSSAATQPPASATQPPASATQPPARDELAGPIPIKADKILAPGRYDVGANTPTGVYAILPSQPTDQCSFARFDRSEGGGTLIHSGTYFGRIYFEVLPSDGRFEVTCPAVHLGELPSQPAPSGPATRITQPGMYLIGVDIEPGRYRFDPSTSPDIGFGKRCWAIVFAGAGQNAQLDSAVSDEGMPLYMIVPPRAAILYAGCNGEKISPEQDAKRPPVLRLPDVPESAKALDALGQRFDAGDYIIGESIPLGLYKGHTANNPSTCRWSKTDKQGTRFVSGYSLTGQFYIELTPEEQGATLTTTCYLVKVDPQSAPRPSQSTILPGMHHVGMDITPGRYRIETSQSEGDRCYLNFLSDFRGLDAQIGPSSVSKRHYLQYGEYLITIPDSVVGVDTSCVMTKAD